MVYTERLIILNPSIPTERDFGHTYFHRFIEECRQYLFPSGDTGKAYKPIYSRPLLPVGASRIPTSPTSAASSLTTYDTIAREISFSFCSSSTRLSHFCHLAQNESIIRWIDCKTATRHVCTFGVNGCTDLICINSLLDEFGVPITDPCSYIPVDMIISLTQDDLYKLSIVLRVNLLIYSVRDSKLIYTRNFRTPFFLSLCLIPAGDLTYVTIISIRGETLGLLFESMGFLSEGQHHRSFDLLSMSTHGWVDFTSHQLYKVIRAHDLVLANSMACRVVHERLIPQNLKSLHPPPFMIGLNEPEINPVWACKSINLIGSWLEHDDIEGFNPMKIHVRGYTTKHYTHHNPFERRFLLDVTEDGKPVIKREILIDKSVNIDHRYVTHLSIYSRFPSLALNFLESFNTIEEISIGMLPNPITLPDQVQINYPYFIRTYRGESIDGDTLDFALLTSPLPVPSYISPIMIKNSDLTSKLLHTLEHGMPFERLSFHFSLPSYVTDMIWRQHMANLSNKTLICYQLNASLKMVINPFSFMMRSNMIPRIIPQSEGMIRDGSVWRFGRDPPSLEQKFQFVVGDTTCGGLEVVNFAAFNDIMVFPCGDVTSYNNPRSSQHTCLKYLFCSYPEDATVYSHQCICGTKYPTRYYATVCCT